MNGDGVLPPVGNHVLFEIAGQTLPARTEAELLVYGQGVVARGMAALLTREKNELLASLRRVDPAAEPEAHKEIQQQLVALENERRSIGGQ